MSLCDSCFSPGACCKRLMLFTNVAAEEGLTLWDDEPVDMMKAYGLPFIPAEKFGTWIDKESGRSYSSWYFNCPILQPDGRCGDYENRPDLCRAFEPTSSMLCVHYRGAESGDPTFSGETY